MANFQDIQQRETGLKQQGSRVVQFKQVMLTAELATDQAIHAAGQWAELAGVWRGLKSRQVNRPGF